MGGRGRGLRQGDIVLINFPFSDRTSSKVRPALVISNDRHNARDVDRLFVLISSNVRLRSEEDILLSPGDPDFAASGLKRPSVLRCTKLINLDSSKLRVRRLGRVSRELLCRVANAISAAVHPS